MQRAQQESSKKEEEGRREAFIHTVSIGDERSSARVSAAVGAAGELGDGVLLFLIRYRYTQGEVTSQSLWSPFRGYNTI